MCTFHNVAYHTTGKFSKSSVIHQTKTTLTINNFLADLACYSFAKRFLLNA